MATVDFRVNLKKLGFFVAAQIALLMLSTTSFSAAQSCSGMSLGNNASLNGFVPFPASNVWNTNIASAPVDPDSDAITGVAGFSGEYLHPDFGSESTYGIPYVVVDSTATPSVPINVIDYADQSDVVVAPYPLTAPIEGNPADCSGWPDTYVGDSHILVLDRAKCELYETYNTHRCNGLYDSSSETIWDMTNYETRPWGWTSADAAGLPIFPGLIRYDEIASGAIHHAIRFTMPVTKNDANGGYFVYPASHAAGVYWGVSNVMGMRIRLKASFDISGFSPVNQIILTAMKQYGMILADNGGYFFFQGVSDPRFDDNDLGNLHSVASSNFEVVQMNPEFPGYDAVTAPTGPVPVINSFTASAATVSMGSPVTLNYSASGDSYDFIDVLGPVAAGSGSVTITPAATQTYTLNSTNAYGRASTPLTVTVTALTATPPDFNIAISPVSIVDSGGVSTPASVTITPMYGFNSAVTFSCSGLSAGMACSFTPATVTPSGAAVSTALTLTSTASASDRNRNSRPFFPATALAAVLCCAGWKKRRRWLLLATCLCMAALLSVCGGVAHAGSGTGARPGMPITITATSGSLQHTTGFSLMVN